MKFRYQILLLAVLGVVSIDASSASNWSKLNPFSLFKKKECKPQSVLTNPDVKQLALESDVVMAYDFLALDCTTDYKKDITQTAVVVEVTLKDGDAGEKKIQGYVMEVDATNDTIVLMPEITLITNGDVAQNQFAHPYYGLTKTQILDLPKSFVTVKLADMKTKARIILAKDINEPAVKNAKPLPGSSLSKYYQQSRSQVELTLWNVLKHPYVSFTLRGSDAHFEAKIGKIRTETRGTTLQTLVSFSKIYSPTGISAKDMQELSQGEVSLDHIRTMNDSLSADTMYKINSLWEMNADQMHSKLKDKQKSGGYIFVHTMDEHKGTYSKVPAKILKILDVDVDNSMIMYRFIVSGKAFERSESLLQFMKRHLEEGFEDVKVKAKNVEAKAENQTERLAEPQAVSKDAERVLAAFRIIKQNIQKPGFKTVVDEFFEKYKNPDYVIKNKVVVKTLHKLGLLEADGSMTLETKFAVFENFSEILGLTNM